MVFDSSTLILIAKIEVLGLFQDSVELEVRIPIDALLIQKAIDESKIRVVTLKDRMVWISLPSSTVSMPCTKTKCSLIRLWNRRLT